MIESYSKFLQTFKVQNISKKKLVIYTVLFGDYDELKELKHIPNNSEIYCFTNQNIKNSYNWNIIYIRNDKLLDIELARLIKVNPHLFFSDFQESIYIDASITFKKDVDKFYLDYLKDQKIVFFKHPLRKCLYKEVEACIILKKENKSLLMKQKNFYKSEFYPKNNGLIATGLIFRKHNVDEIKNLMKKWSQQILLFSYRDQISFNYSSWLLGVKYKAINKDIFYNQYLTIAEHKKKIKISLFTKIRYIIHKVFL